jgi:hypothetical protein
MPLDASGSVKNKEISSIDKNKWSKFYINNWMIYDISVSKVHRNIYWPERCKNK